MTDIDTEYTTAPVCPHCGHRDYDWWDGSDLQNDGDQSDTECGSCEEPMRIIMTVDVSFCSEKRDVEAEKRTLEIRTAKELARTALRRQAAAKFLPFTPVRVNDPRDQWHGKHGTIANVELGRAGFVSVKLDCKSSTTLYNPDELERINGG